MAGQELQAAKPKDPGKLLFLITGIAFALYGGFLIYFLMPQVNAGIHSLLPVLMISIGIIAEGLAICGQSAQRSPKFLATGIIFVVVNIVGLVLFSIRWKFCWPFIIGILLSASYIAFGFVKRRAASAEGGEQAQA